MKQPTATLFGGSGFLGRYVVRELTRAGYRVNVACRNTTAAAFLKVNGPTGQVALLHCDITNPDDVAKAVKHADVVVNLVGVLYSKGKQNFDAIHARGAEHIAQAAKKAGVKQLVHISALGVDTAKADYARTKFTGEEAVIAAFPTAVILRPSIIFGAEDNFFNMFGNLFRFTPVVPLFGGGGNKFQPVYVGDVALAVRKVLESKNFQGKVLELGGSRIYTMRELYEFILRTTNRKKCFVNVPFWLVSLKAGFLELLPHPPLTRDQVRLLQTDNIIRNPDSLGFKDLGITPTPVEDIVPSYLSRFRKG